MNVIPRIFTKIPDFRRPKLRVGEMSDRDIARMFHGHGSRFATTTNSPSYGSTTVLTVTNLQSLASSITAAWQSARTSNLSTKALDWEIGFKLTTANTAPANDKCVYVYVSRAFTTDAGTTWLHDDVGNATVPSGTEGTITVLSNATGPMSSRLLGTIPYNTQNMTMQKSFLLSEAVGQFMPDGFSLIVVNFTGAAFSTGCVVDITPINEQNA